MGYIPALKGYITDVPELWLKRRDGRVFHFDKLSSSNVTPDTQFTEVNGGWSLYPIAYLPGQSTMEAQFESAQFDAELFSMANNTNFTQKAVEVWETVDFILGDEEFPYTVDSTAHTTAITLTTPDDIDGATFYINGFTQDTTIGEGKFTVGTSSESTDHQSYTTVITLGAELEVGNEVIITYSLSKADQMEMLVDNQSTFVGEMILRWPVYSSGEETEAAGVKGYAYMKIFKCRCTAFPGFDTSYKSAVTNGITVSAMDPHRRDGAIYGVMYVEK